MTPFSEAPTPLKPSLLARFSARRALLVFALCLVVGLAMVAWRVKGRLETARAIARIEARSCGASLELQFSQVSGATEALVALAKQGRGALANSVRLQEVLRRSGLGDLPRQGYNFALFIPPPAQPRPLPIASQGLSSLQDTVQQPVRVQNLDLRLALKPRGGWVNKTKAGLEMLAVLLVSAIVSISVNLLESRRAVETELREATRRLASEAAGRSRALADCREANERTATANAELRKTQFALQQAEFKAAQFQAQMDASVCARAEAVGTQQTELNEARSALQQAELTIAQQQTRLDAAAQSEKEASLAAEHQIQQNQAEIADLRVRLETVTRSAQDTAETSAARVAQLERNKRELQERLLVAERAQARAAELQGLLQKAEEELSHWQEASTRSTVVAPAESDDSPPSNVANSVIPNEAAEPLVDVASLTEPSPGRKGGKAARRKPARRDDQLGLFEMEDLVVTPTNQGAAEAEARVVEGRESKIPSIEPAAPAKTPSFDPAETSTEQHEGKESPQEGSEPPGPSPQPTPKPETAEALPRPTSSTIPLDIPLIEGLATNEGLANAAYDPKHYLKVLRQFAEEHVHAPDQIRDALLQGDLTTAQRVVQVLQTAADKIGATAVHKAATALAHACHERSDPGEIESVWGELEKELRELVATLKPIVIPKEDKPAPSRRLPSAPPVEPAQLRKAVNQILPLLVERDPGAKDCLKDNRTTFRSTFAPEAYMEFEQLVKSGNFDLALEQLRKAVRKHGITL